MIDLSQVPFVDGHMHPPLRVRPQTVEEYRWPWFEGLPSESAQVTELVPYRWAIRQLADELGCAADERSVVAATRGLDPPTWLATVCERSQTTGLVVDTGYPPPVRDAAAAADPRRRRRRRAPAPARGRGRRPDRRGRELRRAGRALRRRRERRARRRLRRPQEHRRISQRPRDPPLERRRGRNRARAPARAGVTRVQEQELVDFLLLRALPVARRDDLPVQLHAGYGDRDLDLRLVNPLHLRGMLASEEAQGVHFVVLHAAWPYVREGAFLTAVYANVTLDVATCIPPLGHAALIEAWRCALAVGAINRIHASTDAAGLPEHIALGAARARSTLGQVLAELVGTGELSAGQAERAARRFSPATRAGSTSAKPDGECRGFDQIPGASAILRGFAAAAREDAR